MSFPWAILFPGAALLGVISCQPAAEPSRTAFRLRNLPSGEHTHAYIFRDSDAKAAFAGPLDTEDPSVELPCGRTYRVHLTANVPTAREFMSEAEYLEAGTLLEDSTPEHPSMHADTICIIPGSGPSQLSMHFKRYMCKVTLEHITVRWLDSFDSPPQCSLDTVALVNVAGAAPLSGAPSAMGRWFNKGCIDGEFPQGVRELIINDNGFPVDSSGTVPVGVSLYAMPNPSDGNGYGLPWTERKTRLAVKLTVDGTPNWFPVDLPPMEGNCWYTVSNLVINGPGTPGPDQEPNRSGMQFRLVVLPWEDYNLNLEFQNR